MKAPEELGAEVLARGLPALPEVLTYQMSIPVAYWKASRSAVVLFLHFRQRNFEVPPAGAAHDEVTPMVMMVTFSLDGERWTADPMWYSTGWSHDPIAKPGSLRDLDGRAIAGGGGEFSDQPGPHYPAAIATGRAAPAVKADCPHPGRPRGPTAPGVAFRRLGHLHRADVSVPGNCAGRKRCFPRQHPL